MIEQFSAPVTLLVIDDDVTTLDLLTRLAEKMGAVEIMTAKDGGSGLLIACDKKPTLVVCDLGMYPVDGFSFLAGLRNSRDPVVASIPVVMFTAEGDTASEIRANKLGSTAYFKKPFNPRGLADRLYAIAEGRLSELVEMAEKSGERSRSIAS